MDKLHLVKEDVKSIYQSLSFEGNNDSEQNSFATHSLKLIELNQSALNCIQKGSRLVIRGDASDSAVLCTDDETFELKEAETSNSLLLATNLLLADEVASKQSDDEPLQQRHVTVLSPLHTYYELRTVAPRLHQLNELLQSSMYRGREYETDDDFDEEEADDRNRVRFYSVDDLLDVVQSSRGQLIAGLRDIEAVLIDGKWRLLEFEFRVRCLNLLLNLIDENSWSLFAFPVEETLATLEDLQPRPIVQQLIEQFATDTGDTDANGATLYALREDRVCRAFAELMLRAGSKFNLQDFLESWQQSVPEVTIITIRHNMAHLAAAASQAQLLKAKQLHVATLLDMTVPELIKRRLPIEPGFQEFYANLRRGLAITTVVPAEEIVLEFRTIVPVGPNVTDRMFGVIHDDRCDAEDYVVPALDDGQLRWLHANLRADPWLIMLITTPQIMRQVWRPDCFPHMPLLSPIRLPLSPGRSSRYDRSPPRLRDVNEDIIDQLTNALDDSRYGTDDGRDSRRDSRRPSADGDRDSTMGSTLTHHAPASRKRTVFSHDQDKFVTSESRLSGIDASLPTARTNQPLPAMLEMWNRQCGTVLEGGQTKWEPAFKRTRLLTYFRAEGEFAAPSRGYSFQDHNLNEADKNHADVEDYFAAIGRIFLQLAMLSHDQQTDTIAMLRAEHHDEAADFLAENAHDFVLKHPLHTTANDGLTLAVEGFTSSIQRRRTLGATKAQAAAIQLIPWSQAQLFVPRPDKDYSHKPNYDLLAKLQTALAYVPPTPAAASKTSTSNNGRSGGGGGGGGGGGANFNNRPSYPFHGGNNNNSSSQPNNNYASGRNNAPQSGGNNRNNQKSGPRGHAKKGGGGGRGAR